MKTITKEWLIEKRACSSRLEYAIKNGYIGLSPEKFIQKLIREGRLSDAIWLSVRAMNKKQNAQCAVFAAEQVVHIFEKVHQSDTRPRNAIEAAKKYIEKPCKQTKDDAARAAHAAAHAAHAAHAAAHAVRAAYAAVDAAFAAHAAHAHAAFAAHAVIDAARAAHAAADATTKAGKGVQIKILKKGIELLKK